MENIKCVIVGDGTIGKTSMLISYVNNLFSTVYVPTVFDNYTVQVMCDGYPVTLSLWDTAGQEDYDSLRPISYYNTDIFIACYCISDRFSLENLKTKWIPEIKNHDKNVPFVIVGTKSDLRRDQESLDKLRLKGQDIVSSHQVDQISRDFGAVSVMECSAKTRENLDDVFEQIIRIVLSIKHDSISTNKNNQCDDCCIVS